MSQVHTEAAFEAHVGALLRGQAGWTMGVLTEWDADRALFPARILAFLQETQPTLWAEMHTLHGAGLEPLLLATLAKELDLKGTLHVLRHGFKFYGKTFRLAYFKPAHGLNDEVLALYAKNHLTVTRQVPCHPSRRLHRGSALRGERPAGGDLRTEESRARARLGGTRCGSTSEDRDPRAPLFEFKKRALVHFAADPDEVHMTTRLAGEETHFLPFNRGSHPGEIQCGAGNPAAPVRLPHRLLLGGGAPARQLPRHPRPLHVHREEGGEGGRRPGRPTTW